MFNNIRETLFIFLLLNSIFNIQNILASQLKLTKVKCNSTDESFATFKTCEIKPVSRNLQYITVYIKFHQLPINDIKAHFQFLKRANGYKPFLYNFVFKCDFLKHLNPVTKIVWGWFIDVSNLNHTCPLTEDFIIPRLENRYIEQQLSSLPLVNGDYALFFDFYAYNVSRFHAEFYVTLY